MIGAGVAGAETMYNSFVSHQHHEPEVLMEGIHEYSPKESTSHASLRHSKPKCLERALVDKGCMSDDHITRIIHCIFAKIS